MTRTQTRLSILLLTLSAACARDPDGGGETESESSGTLEGSTTDATSADETTDTSESGDGDGDTTGDGDGDTTGDGDGDGDTGPMPDCDNLNPLPLDFVEVPGARRSEDFAFDANGYLLSIRQNALFRAAYGEDYELMFPGVSSNRTAGTAVLPNGDVVFNDVDYGRVTRVTPSGVTSTVVGSLPYPNGIQVDQNGWVYVALDDGASVIRFDPDNPVPETIAETDGPNGLAFSADYERLYIGSYDHGGVKMLDLNTMELTVINDDLGGVDGVLTDVCDNVYVTQYDVGRVWRIAPDQSVDLVAELPSWWIPNLNFGSGVGGWKHDHIYVSDFTDNRVFELDPGTWGIDQPQL